MATVSDNSVTCSVKSTSSDTIAPETPVGQLVAEAPLRARVFGRFGIDFCCGGKQTLAEAARRAGVSIAGVVAALAEVGPAPANDRNWLAAPLSELADHIEGQHHAFLRRELPNLNALAAKVAEVHGAKHPELSAVQRTLAALTGELALHLMKEERILFPLIREMEAAHSAGDAHCGSVANPVRVMESEHDGAGDALRELRRLTHNYAPPADACGSFRALLGGLAALEADLHQHIHLENNILFARAIALESTRA